MSLDEQVIRVRFAPSPTGPLHIGGVRTALYNFLFARKNQGKFMLRIEDTDQKRFVPGAEKYIFESLNWCGLSVDEGPQTGGPYGPYRQSERREIYSSFMYQLLDSGHAYYAFDTPEELDQMRDNMRRAGVSSPTYNSISRNNMKNSLTLSSEETQRLLVAGTKYVVRIKMPRDQEIKFEDQIRGWVSVNSNHVDDKVIYKSDGMPTYHLANVVDDYTMKITHVIRGEEWLPSAPLHVYLYECLGWEKSIPTFAHLPLILKPDGNGKLSKRDGDRLGFPVFPLDWHHKGEVFPGYKEMGFSPEAFINMLVFLGWNPGSASEVFSLTELISEFSLERVGRSGAKYDYTKMKWFNQQHLRLKTDLELFNTMVSIDDSILNNFSKEYILNVISLVKERAVFLSDILIEADYFFTETVLFNEKAVSKKWNSDLTPSLELLLQKLLSLNDFRQQTIEDAFHQHLTEEELRLGDLLPMLRIALTGRLAGPSMFSVIALLGKERLSNRILRAVKNI